MDHGLSGYMPLGSPFRPSGHGGPTREEMYVVEVAPQLQDHAVGLEMEIVELARQADEAAHDGWPEREAELRAQLMKLYSELASVAERLTDEVSAAAPVAEVAADPASVSIKS